MTQTWNDVLFVHWRVSKDALRSLVPAELEIDLFDHTAWVSVIPFYVTHFRLRYAPPLPFIHSFFELNVRTYVSFKGIQGIYFFSLDAASRLAVMGGQSLFHLPYYYAEMNMRKLGTDILVECSRKDNKGGPAQFSGTFKPISDPYFSKKETLDYWLTERYRLYTTHKNKLYYEDIHHKQWELQHVDLTITKNSMLLQRPLSVQAEEPLFHYAKRQKVLCWPFRSIDT